MRDRLGANMTTSSRVTTWLCAGALAAALVAIPTDASETQQGAAGRGGAAQARKRVLLFGHATGWHHGSISGALANMYKVLVDSGLFDVEIKTDARWISKQKNAFIGEGQNLDTVDVLMAISTVGEWELNDQQKRDLLAFVHDDGKGFVGSHGALDANHKWPEYLEMIGGEFVSHPWNTFAAPVIIEDSSFPAMRHFPAREFTHTDEMYMTRGPWARDKVNVLMRLDETKLPAARGRGALREDQDFAITWAKTYGKGRVFYSSIGHVKEAWVNPDIQKMFLEAVKWAAGLIDGSTASHPKRQM
jgi:type 1 glutamine amidotransferase